MFTWNNQVASYNEFLALNVPVAKAVAVDNTMRILRECGVEHGQVVSGNGLDLLAKLLLHEEKQQLSEALPYAKFLPDHPPGLFTCVNIPA